MSIAYFRFPIRWKNQPLPHATSPAVEFSQTSNIRIPRREKKPSISIIVAIFDLHSSFTKPLVPPLGRKRGRGATRDIISPTNLSYNSLSVTPPSTVGRNEVEKDRDYLTQLSFEIIPLSSAYKTVIYRGLVLEDYVISWLAARANPRAK